MHTPVDESFPALLSALNSTRRAILTAPPGSGKTTRVPVFLKDNFPGTILMLEPRRIAARAAAHFMASQLGEKTGESIGYRVRLDSRVGRNTRVEIITEGILTRRLIDDPELSGVSCVIFDEFHERSLHADTGLALCLEVQQALRPDLNILVMSATLDSDAVSSYLAPCTVVHAEGRQWPVEIRHAPFPGGNASSFEQRGDLCRHAAAVIRNAIATEKGSLLAFLPGQAEIRMTAEHLAGLPDGIDIFPLYGDLSPAEQDQAISPPEKGRRKVVLATSIAETSLTIEGIRIVVDCGLTRVSRYSAATGMSSLATENITQDAADQRAGRAGRLEPGICIRLWHEGTPLIPVRRPEIAEADLAPFLLSMLSWGANPAEMNFLTPPPKASLQAAESLLEELGAIQRLPLGLALTSVGKAMARLPLHPRLAYMLLSAKGHEHLAAALAALSEEHMSSRSADIRTLLPVLMHSSRLLAAAQQIYSLSGAQGRFSYHDALLDEASCGILISLAWPDRIAQKRRRGSFRLTSGRGAVLAEEDPLSGEEFLAIAAMDGGISGSGRIFLAAPLSKDDLEEFHGRGVENDIVEWDQKTEAVLAHHVRSIGAIILEDAPLAAGKAPSAKILEAMLFGITQLGINCLPWTEELRQWQARVRLLRFMEGNSWPDVSDEALFESIRSEGSSCWLAPWLNSIGKRSQLSSIDLSRALRSLLPASLHHRLEKEAPASITVPSGSTVMLDYTDESGPSLSVKLQEMFGQPTSPSVCSGKCPVTLKLLSPAGRPLQITRDLAGFWAGAYASVRSEMKGRYPKHPWPEDPITSTPTRKTNKALAKEKNPRTKPM